MPSEATVERRSESGTVSFSSTLSAWPVRASISSSCASVSRRVLLGAVADMDRSFRPSRLVSANHRQPGPPRAASHHPPGMNRAAQSAPGRWTMPPPPSTKSPASGEAGSQEVGQAARNARKPRHADEDGVSHVRDPEPLRRRACRAGAAAKRGRDPALAGAGWGAKPTRPGAAVGGAASVADHRGHPVHLGWPPWHRRTGPRARPGCWSGPVSDRSTPTIWPRWPSRPRGIPE
jgi:hypothetical protein